MIHEVARSIEDQVEVRVEDSVASFLGICFFYKRGAGILQIRNEWHVHSCSRVKYI